MYLLFNIKPSIRFLPPVLSRTSLSTFSYFSWGFWSIPRLDWLYNPFIKFWVYPGVFSQLDVPRRPPQGPGGIQITCPDHLTGSFQCRRSSASTWSSSLCPWGWALSFPPLVSVSVPDCRRGLDWRSTDELKALGLLLTCIVGNHASCMNRKTVQKQHHRDGQSSFSKWIFLVLVYGTRTTANLLIQYQPQLDSAACKRTECLPRALSSTPWPIM